MQKNFEINFNSNYNQGHRKILVGLFFKTFNSSYGDNFRTQREIELHSLEDTIAFYNSSENARELSAILFDHWRAPQLFEDTNVF